MKVKAIYILKLFLNLISYGFLEQIWRGSILFVHRQKVRRLPLYLTFFSGGSNKYSSCLHLLKVEIKVWVVRRFVFRFQLLDTFSSSKYFL